MTSLEGDFPRYHKQQAVSAYMCVVCECLYNIMIHTCVLCINYLLNLSVTLCIVHLATMQQLLTIQDGSGYFAVEHTAAVGVSKMADVEYSNGHRDITVR